MIVFISLRASAKPTQDQMMSQMSCSHKTCHTPGACRSFCCFFLCSSWFLLVSPAAFPRPAGP